jgi:hypothetical protein
MQVTDELSDQNDENAEDNVNAGTDIAVSNHKSVNIKTKLEAINYAEKTSKRAAAIKYHVDRKQIREWSKKKEVLQTMVRNGDG